MTNWVSTSNFLKKTIFFKLLYISLHTNKRLKLFLTKKTDI